MTPIEVPVAGGELHALVWGDPDSQPVLVGLHGITASAISLQPVADRLVDHFSIVAPDLRGRGRSADLGGPFGMAAHAADAVAVLDHLGVAEAAVLGESMGAWAAVQLALDHPTRVRQLFLIDGGLPIPVPPGVDADTLIAAVLGPALERLRMTFESRQQYFDFWRAHPAFRGEQWTPYLEDYLDADLTGAPPLLRSAVSEEAVLADGRDQLLANAPGRLAAIDCPVTIVRAPRNLVDEPQPLFPDAIVEAARADLPHLDDRLVDDVNHYTLFLSHRGADAIAAAVRDTDISARDDC